MKASIEMIILGAATLLSGIHGSNGNHTADAIKNAVATAVKIAEEADAVMTVLNPPPPQQQP